MVRRALLEFSASFVSRTISSRSKDPASILEPFPALPDPRREHRKVYMINDIMFRSSVAVLCGADSCQQIADYSQSQSDWLNTFLTLPGGIPSHDTFRRVFCLLDPLAFQACFSDWMTVLMNRQGLIPIPIDQPALKPIAIDGKTQRGSAQRLSIPPCTWSALGRWRTT
ncbi:MAG: ISAs1 family transposase [Isosphaeraceae bacterium]|jgi:hypothetical protein